MKYSKQREAILNIVQNSCNHPTANMVFTQLKTIIPNISLGTVYRNLNVLSENKTIQKIPIANGSDCFDKTVSNHGHIHCINCNNVSDIDEQISKQLVANIINHTDYNIINYDIVFNGICHQCQKKEGLQWN